MSITQKKVLALLGSLALISVAVLLLAPRAKANPSTLQRAQTTTCGAFTGSSTPTYMTAGTATTTYTYDSFCGGATSADSAALLVQFAGASPAAVLNADVQYSQDGIDWYAIGYAGGSDVNSATSSPSIGTVQQLTFPFASSTISRGVVTNANSATSTRIIRLPTPTRFTRVLFTLPVGSTNGAVWAEFVGKKQNP